MISKTLFRLAAVALFGVALAFAAETKTESKVAKCCTDAAKDNKACAHSCCMEAAKAGNNCSKCGGSGPVAKKEAKK